jgi:dTDP-4-dehydrorhamnose 3,5-epimerase
MLKYSKLAIEGAYVIHNFSAKDERGIFVKTFHFEDFELEGFRYHFKEAYYSLSNVNVVRGMHFQHPPYDHDKLVYVSEGSIIDVVLDLRKQSTSFGKCISLELHAFGDSILIPKGCAHGFCTPTQPATVHYMVTSSYQSSSDDGILWNSFGFEWPVKDPILSNRDQGFIKFLEFNSPF